LPKRRPRINTRDIVRNVFEKIFNVSLDEDYALHSPPCQEDVKNFVLGRGPGPNVEDLRIDMRGKINSVWNQAVIEILLAEVKKEDFEGLPDRSDAYLADKIEGKLERVRTVWRTAQPRVTETGDLETIEEVERRMVDAKETREKVVRANTRRKSVHIFGFSTEPMFTIHRGSHEG